MSTADLFAPLTAREQCLASYEAYTVAMLAGIAARRIRKARRIISAARYKADLYTRYAATFDDSPDYPKDDRDADRRRAERLRTRAAKLETAIS